MKNNVKMSLIELAGTPAEVGRGWGKAIAENMHQGLNRILTVVNEVHKTSRAEALSYAMKLWPAAKQFDPELEHFVRGQAQGAAMSLEEAWATRCGLELLFVNTGLAAMCTTLAGTGLATPDGQSIIGQNIDWFKGTPIALLHIKRSDGLRQLVLPLLGLDEYTLNSAGLACCLNGVSAIQPNLKSKISMGAYLPRAMRQTDITKARQLLEQACRGIVAVTLADAKANLLCVEGTLDDYEVLQPHDGFLTHANNYKTSRFQVVDGCQMIFPDSPARTARINELAAGLAGRLTPQALGQALADHQGYPNSICRHPDPSVLPGLQAETLGSFIMLPSEGTMLITEGNPCTHEYVCYDV
ncbi:C45 family autoproteolytic acyltransferase/hydolase [Desulfogranum japonicum]|uniref:C45 family autoproteolytic acyltransferase/hydolase n=1 Tax=Desulfogranum japonicum TaxID=231447 RepID=UPI000405D42B|nr:C45 family peptidase [Desulfogranum japonicum]